MGGIRNASKILVRIPERKRRVRRWDDNNKMYYKETGWVVVDLSPVPQVRDQWRELINYARKLQVP
jgi:hypothetical protein